LHRANLISAAVETVEEKRVILTFVYVSPANLLTTWQSMNYRPSFWMSVAACWALAFPACSVVAEEPTREQVAFFEEHVRPILVEHCLECHGSDRQRGGLRVDSLGSLLVGGESGASIVPGKPDESLMIEAVRYKSYEMPPSGKLPESKIETLARWVQLGAPWPGHDASVRVSGTGQPKITDEDRAYWAFQPVRAVAPPDVDDNGWCRNDLDRFVLQRLGDHELAPADEASPVALIRRVYFDLIGLPPTPAEIDDFLADTQPGAYQRVVEDLLARPQYGERWARHWLDLVRYAESDGYRADGYRPYAWRYRDYVIRAFNDDKPYDQFIIEQLAGDELGPQDTDALAATTYLRHWVYEYNQRDVRTQWDIILNDITNVTGEVFLGLGIGCARCHDHKFDPILQEDYYRLKAFFAPLLPREDVPFATAEQVRDYQTRRTVWEEKTAEIRRQIDEIQQPLITRAMERAAAKFPLDIRPMLLTPPAEREPLEHQLAELAYRQGKAEVEKIKFADQLQGEQKTRWEELQQKLHEFDSIKPEPLPPAITVTDVGPVAPPTEIPGDRQDRDIQPGFLTVLDPEPAKISAPPTGNSTGRRTALARWLTNPANPLTARVMVNRIWQQHFGTGLVETASDFGRLGQRPTHPELLDWLAREFIDGGWRFKRLHRLIVTSATYRQSALRPMPQRAASEDPNNRLLWRMNVRRLDAEQIRDATLAASGQLDLSVGGASVNASTPRRSIYTKFIRNSRDPLLAVFDGADGFVSTDRRNVTTTPTQALLMINGPWTRTRASAFAKRLRALEASSDGERIALAYRLACGRKPAAAELESVEQFLRSQTRTIADGTRREATEPVWGNISGRQGRAAALAPGTPQDRLIVPNSPSLPSGDFTIEAVIQLDSLYKDATVRTIVSHWDSNSSHPGWALGVTSERSAYKPRNLILQLVGDPARGGAGYEVIASGLRPQLNRPYYVAVSVRIADVSPAGVTFTMRDLSQADAAVQTAHVAHKVTGHYRSPGALVIGGRDGANSHRWDGLIDDVRVSDSALPAEQLLLVDDSESASTVGFWRFEESTGFYADSSRHGNSLFASDAWTTAAGDPTSAAWVDFCHVLLNSNEFLYVD
jgi:mono/diheme cytochrome c family protein